MRIIAGEFRSRRIKTIPGLALRPTSDRLRETLFNILGDKVRGSTFVDCYAGSGAVGLEAISRGAATAVFLEQSKSSLRVLHENIASLGVALRSTVFEGPVSKTLPAAIRMQPTIIFLDPPYSAAEEYTNTLAAVANSAAVIVAEHASRSPLETPAELSCSRVLKQGDSSLSFYISKQIHR